MSTRPHKTRFMGNTVVDDEITLTPIAAQHAPALFSVVDNSRQYMRRYQNWPDYIITIHDMQDLINESLIKRSNNHGFDMTIFFRQHIVGKIGLVYIKWEERRAEIGYWLAKTYQGHGIMTRSCKALIDYAFTQMNLDCIQIRCAVGNVRSRSIAERLGFQNDGILENPVWIHGIMQREVVYSMYDTDWKRQKNNE